MIDSQLNKTASPQRSGPWSRSQLVSLAESEHHKRSSAQFASAKRWRDLSYSKEAVWADFTRADAAVRTTLRLSPLSFNCDCSQRLSPCFHALGLALLYAEQPELFALSDQVAPNPPVSFAYTAPLSPEAERQRYAELMTGLEAFELWCHDLIRDGLESLDARSKSYFTQISDRLIDARAPKLAQDVRAWSAPNKLTHHAHLLAELGEWQLVIQGFKRLYELPKEVQADLKLRVGWSPEHEQEVQDSWQVLGRRSALVVGKRRQRVWLWGEQSGRLALVVHVPEDITQRETRLLTGAVVQAELSFFAGTAPLQAELKTWADYATATTNRPQMSGSIQEASSSVATTLAKNPWRKLHPLLLTGMEFERADDIWFIRDAAGYALPLVAPCPHLWQLLALARSGDLNVFGEWDERSFRPLSIWQAAGWLDLNVLRGRK